VAFLRRLFGGGQPPAEPDDSPEPPAPSDVDDTPEDEEARSRELLRGEARRLHDDLIQRQLRYADRAWAPPPEGGERRADDGERRADDGERRADEA
jgi:hypothetical protein